MIEAFYISYKVVVAIKIGMYFIIEGVHYKAGRKTSWMIELLPRDISKIPFCFHLYVMVHINSLC